MPRSQSRLQPLLPAGGCCVGTAVRESTIAPNPHQDVGPGPWCREGRRAGLGHFLKLVKRRLQHICRFLRRTPGRSRHRRLDGLYQGQIDTLGQHPTPAPGKEETKLMTRWPSDFHLGVRGLWPLRVSHAGRKRPPSASLVMRGCSSH